MPVRFRDLKRALERMGVEVTPSPGGGSHYHASKGGRTYAIPAAHGLNAEVYDVYVRGACKVLGLDEGELRKKL